MLLISVRQAKLLTGDNYVEKEFLNTNKKAKIVLRSHVL